MSTKQNPLIKKIYIPIDCLLDTRLGTLTQIDVDFAFTVSNSPKYYLRETDLFQTKEQGTLSKETFNQVSEAYKEEIIRNSLVTRLFEFINELCIYFTQSAVASPYYGDIEIDINIHGYDFNNTEISGILSAISQHLSKLITINIVDLSIEQLTLPYVKENYIVMFMYNPKPWLDYYNNDLQKNLMSGITFYCPRINHIRELTEDEKRLIKDEHMDLFLILKQLLSSFIIIEFLPIALFCANTMQNKKEYYT